MKALQAAVIVMAILIVAGVAVIGITIVRRASQADAPPVPEGHVAFGDVQVTVPAGARVVWATVDAGRLVVHVQGTGEAARFEVIDLATGGRLGVVRVAAEAPR